MTARAVEETLGVAVGWHFYPETVDERAVFPTRTCGFETLDGRPGATYLVVVGRERGIERLRVLRSHERLAPIAQAACVESFTYGTINVGEGVRRLSDHALEHMTLCARFTPKYERKRSCYYTCDDTRPDRN